MTRVFDVQGQEQDLAWMAQQYDGATVLTANTAGATEVWRLVAVYCTEGPALLKAEVRNKAGQPVVNQPIAMTYPSLASPNSELQSLVAYATRWSDRGVVHRSNDAGLFGFGLGTTYGPFYHVWVLSSAPSDCLSGTGMKGRTEHQGPLHPVWQLQDVEPVHANLQGALLWNSEKNQVIQFNVGAALQKAIFAAGFVPNSGEFRVQWDGQTYVGQRAEHLRNGEVRVYYCKEGNWGNVRYVVRDAQ